MKYLLSLLITGILLINITAQNVGIGTTTPNEKLHVAGNILTTGEIKPNGTTGQANQVLTSNGNGTMQWAAAAATNNNYSNIGGFGSWGGCDVENITDYYPVADSVGNYYSYFGSAVAISGDYAIVGAPNDNASGILNAGSATIFKRNINTGEWEKQARLYEVMPSGFDQFGFSVAINGDYAVVGAPQDDNSGFIDNGAAYVYRRNSATGAWVLHTKLSGQNADTYDNFGWCVSVGNNYVIVGTPHDDITIGQNTAYNTGSVSSFKLNTTYDIWELSQKLSGSVPLNTFQFGISISMSGDNLIVGAAGTLNPNMNVITGSATIFKRNISTNLWQSGVDFYGIYEHGKFGSAVSISGDVAAISTPHGDPGPGATCTDCGIINFIYKNPQDVWSAGLIPLQNNTTTNFGSTLSLSNNYLLVGDSDANGGGKARIYKKTNALWIQVQEFGATQPSIIPEEFGYSVAIDASSNRFVIGARSMAQFGMAFFGKVK